jgi:hypothetical protein
VGRAVGPPQPRDAGWLRIQRSWLVVERLPADAPDLDPVEGLWSSLNAVERTNLTSPTWPR